VFATIVVWDIVAVIEPTPGDTVSKVVLGLAKQYPIVSQAAGFLAGHLFIPMDLQCTELEYWRVSLFVAGAMWAALTILWHYDLTPDFTVSDWFLTFMLMGHLLFPQAME